MSFFAELKRRSVYKVAVVYAKPEPSSNFGVRRWTLASGFVEPTARRDVRRSVFALLKATTSVSVHNRTAFRDASEFPKLATASPSFSGQDKIEARSWQLVRSEEHTS